MPLSLLVRPGRLWWLARRDLKRGAAAAWHDHVTAGRIFTACRSLPDAHTDAALPSVHVLTGEEQCLLTAWMLASWLHYTERSWDIHIHADGSLTSASSAALSRLFPGIHIHTRAWADRTMGPVLEPFPRCAGYRAKHPLGIKAFDIPHLAPSSRLILLDSDVLFFARPEELLAWADDPETTDTWFNQDPVEPSPIAPQTCREDLGFALWPRVNSGLCLLQRDLCDLTAFERWIAHSSIALGKAWRTEQTLLALAASRAGQGGLLPEAYEVSLGAHRAPGSIARHYVGAVRNRFYAEGVGTLRHVLLRS